MLTPLAIADSLRIGSVDFVSPDEIKVLLDVEAPRRCAEWCSAPISCITVMSLFQWAGFVAQIEWITIERSQYPKRKGIQDFGIVDCCFHCAKWVWILLGFERNNWKGWKFWIRFFPWVEIYPTVGDPTVPSQAELKAIVESGENRRVNGISPLAEMQLFQ